MKAVDVAEMAFALYADRKESGAVKTGFDPADRAAWQVKHAKWPPLEPNRAGYERYTFRVDPQKLVTNNDGHRLVPNDKVGGDGDSRSPEAFDSKSIPIPPLGTHSWLFEFPASANTTDPFVEFDYASIQVIEWSAVDVMVSYAILDEVNGAPGFVGDVEQFPAFYNSTFQLTKIQHLNGHAPRFALATVTNLDPKDLAFYKVSVSLPAQCQEDCWPAFFDWWIKKGCPATSCIGKDAKCQKDFANYDKMLPHAQNFCRFACSHYGALDKTYPPDAGSSNWRKNFASFAKVDATTTKAGFYPLKQWPFPEYACGSFICDSVTNPSCTK